MRLPTGTKPRRRRHSPLLSPAKTRPNTDFGQGFYTTTWLSQAQEWAEQKAATVGKQPAVVKLTLDRLALRSLKSLAFVRGSLDAEDLTPNASYGGYSGVCRR